MIKIFVLLVVFNTMIFASSPTLNQQYEKNKTELKLSYDKAYKVMEKIHYNGDKFKLLHDTWYRYENQNCHFLEKLLKEDNTYTKCMNKALKERIQKYKEWVDF
jgi:hypothetical protein